MLRQVLVGACFFCVIVGLSASASAIVIAGADGTATSVAPYDDPGWANVGRLSATRNGSCVYLGNGWVITASHIGAGNPSSWTDQFGNPCLFNGLSYQLHDPDPGSENVNADLIMFQLTSIPVGVSELMISSDAPALDSEILAMGYGVGRSTNAETWWNSSWQETTGTPDYRGFYYQGGWGTKRWGTNNVTGVWEGSTFGTTSTECQYVAFDRGVSDTEMQAASSDSGGAVFYKNGDSWELTGILLAINYYENQPSLPTSLQTAVYGNETYFADLSRYKTQIDAIIATPEPGTVTLLTIGAAALGVFGWVRRKRAA